jgi:hypothetical protein
MSGQLDEHGNIQELVKSDRGIACRRGKHVWPVDLCSVPGIAHCSPVRAGPEETCASAEKRYWVPYALQG